MSEGNSELMGINIEIQKKQNEKELIEGVLEELYQENL